MNGYAFGTPKDATLFLGRLRAAWDLEMRYALVGNMAYTDVPFDVCAFLWRAEMRTRDGQVGGFAMHAGLGPEEEATIMERMPV